MNLSVQNYIINKNANYTVVQKPKTGFKGKFLTPEAFAAESSIIEKINSLPDCIFKERTEFLKFCKSIDITPKINGAITKRLADLHNKNKQKTADSDNALKSTIEHCRRLIEGYKRLLDDGREFLKNEIAEIKEIISDSKLPQDIRDKAKTLLK